MLDKLNCLKNPNLVPYIVYTIIFLSFIKDLGLFSEAEQPGQTPFNSELETLQDLTSNCLIFSSSFCIKAQLRDEALVIGLVDYKNWAIYERAYTKNDIGIEINRKIDLNNIISVFRNVNGNGRFEFGAVAKSGSGQEMFSVEEGGVVNVFVEVWTKSSKELVKSRLNLIKQRNMREMEVFLVKLEIQKREFNSLLNAKVLTLEKENKSLKERVKALEKGRFDFDFDFGQQLEEEEAKENYQGLDMNKKYKAERPRGPNESRVHIKI